MMEFTIPSMTCGHCVGVVTKAIERIDARARVDIALSTHQVRVETKVDPQSIRRALTEAGYPPE